MDQKIFNRSFIFLFLAQFCFSFVFCVLLPTIPIYLSRLGANEAKIGVLVGALSVAALICRPLVGRGLLHIPEKHFMIAGSIIFALSSFAYLMAKPFWPLMIVRVFQGIRWALFVTSTWTLVSRIIPDTQRGRGLSYFYLAFNTAFAVAPSIGVFLINHFSFAVLFLTCTALSLCALYVSVNLENPRENTLELQEGGTQRQSLFTREVIAPSVIIFLSNIIWGALTAFFPLFALKQGVANPGLFFGALAITLIVSRMAGARFLDVPDRTKIIVPSLIVQVVAMILLSFSKTLPMFILVAVIMGIGNAFLFPSLIAYIIDQAGANRGPAMATYLALADFGAGIGSVIMGVILQLTSYRTMFLSLALTSCLSLCYSQFVLSKRRMVKNANLRIPL
jgi:predicted MFS family arabinose efflux permease